MNMLDEQIPAKNRSSFWEYKFWWCFSMEYKNNFQWI